ncbi:hypothetical protein Cgig2_015427 [Carnegiea gigantea]|uniref:HIT domain-containing protein n=1 Tax=Carnegiea gigantea TaxID=171969 RepID=A0A9Q1Q972_9CARY|nr:hypothetical protein Cgig2_015427 [Carnegiea gigantea]
MDMEAHRRRLAVLSSHLRPPLIHSINSQFVSASNCSSQSRDDEFQTPKLKQNAALRGDCVFCQIIDGQSPAFKIYEDDTCLCILDINPLSLGHSLLIPKFHFCSLDATPPSVTASIIQSPVYRLVSVKHMHVEKYILDAAKLYRVTNLDIVRISHQGSQSYVVQMTCPRVWPFKLLFPFLTFIRGQFVIVQSSCRVCKYLSEMPNNQTTKWRLAQLDSKHVKISNKNGGFGVWMHISVRLPTRVQNHTWFKVQMWPYNVISSLHVAVIKALQLISDVQWFLLRVSSSPGNENLNFIDKTAHTGGNPLSWSFGQYLQNSRAKSLLYVIAAMCSKIPIISDAIKKATECDSFNLLVNNGAAAGQVIFHTHIHIIPRKACDRLWASESLRRLSLKLDEEASQLAESIRQHLSIAGKGEDFKGQGSNLASNLQD